MITLSDPAAEPLETLLVSVLVLATLAALGRFLYEAWRAMLPAEVQIDPRSVAYRGRSVATAQVVERERRRDLRLHTTPHSRDPSRLLRAAVRRARRRRTATCHAEERAAVVMAWSR